MFIIDQNGVKRLLSKETLIDLLRQFEFGITTSSFNKKSIIEDYKQKIISAKGTHNGYRLLTDRIKDDESLSVDEKLTLLNLMR